MAKAEFNVYNGSEPYIFISYSHNDSDIVYDILNRLDRERFRLWFDETMEIGEDFRVELRERIEKCGAMLLFVSESSMHSKYVGMEIITAFKNDIRIYPIYISEDVCIPDALKMVLENLQHVKGCTGNDCDKYVTKLIESLPVETMHSLEIEGETLIKCKDGSSSIVLPEQVKIIANGAFRHCIKLEEITFSAATEQIGEEAFRGCKSIKRIIMPKKIKSVGESAFRDCIGLTELVIENDEIEIGERAFENCPSLEHIELPDGLMEIYGGVFNSCRALKEVKLPSKLTVLGESAFSSCVSLKSITIPDNVKKIDDMAFNGCVELESIKLSESVIKIGKCAFKECKALTAIQIPVGVSYIGAGLFRGCDELCYISVSQKNRYYKSFEDVLFNKNRSILICYPAAKSAEHYDIPDSVTKICDWAFCGCSKLKSITIPDSVTEIGEGAFYKCVSLESIEIVESVVRIDDVAFRGCTDLKEVIIPDTVKEFGWGIFNGCENIVVKCNDDSAAAKYCRMKNIRCRSL